MVHKPSQVSHLAHFARLWITRISPRSCPPHRPVAGRTVPNRPYAARDARSVRQRKLSKIRFRHDVEPRGRTFPGSRSGFSSPAWTDSPSRSTSVPNVYPFCHCSPHQEFLNSASVLSIVSLVTSPLYRPFRSLMNLLQNSRHSDL